jgi:hypothetical protein
MPSTLTIHPDTVYTEGAIAVALDLPQATLARARREGRLRYSRQGPRVLIRGAWLLTWLESTSRPESEVGHAS